MTTIHARIDSSKLSNLRMISSNRAEYNGRQIDFTTTFTNHLEIRAIRELNGHTVSASELRNWPDYRVAQDEGIMALFASNKKWTSLKFGIDTHKVDLQVVQGHSEPKETEDLAHLLYCIELMADGFAYESGGVFSEIRQIGYHDAINLASTGSASSLRVKTRLGQLEFWAPVLDVVANIPRQRRPSVSESNYATAGETIARIVGIGMAALLRR
ncbi:hypothetical protein FDI21_gp007 [Pseudomonas phage Noxifer]|uniref:Uncharacterized protein n=1 Tax=Pseudomonas phage Noxifer TaxID=2006684 RepID=A0A1Y0T0Y7_9CAUD|nr:hypothetical protein FDI21_gp007 [Pseudomonas phage Noxifer]ARV77178.1 hypothetical protein NOXIFER_7 [Pseudomonas phage Noxifer]